MTKFRAPSGFEPTYKGLKLLGKAELKPIAPRFEPTYKGLKRLTPDLMERFIQFRAYLQGL